MSNHNVQCRIRLTKSLEVVHGNCAPAPTQSGTGVWADHIVTQTIKSREWLVKIAGYQEYFTINSKSWDE